MDRSRPPRSISRLLRNATLRFVARVAVSGLALAVSGLAGGFATVSSGSAARNGTALSTTSPDVSSNWAGYVATGPGSTATTASASMSYTDVTGQWVEPKATCTGQPTSVALWVGLGGYSESSQELEQAGSSADCSAGGTPSYYAWYELVPANSVNIKLKINAGDVIASSVVDKGTGILVQITDRTRGTRFTRRLTMASPDLTSAEWIAEAPAECDSANSCQQLALTNFSAVNFTRTFAIGNNIPGTITNPNWTATAIQLIPRAHRFFGDSYNSGSNSVGAGAVPIGLAADGSGFTLDWRADAAAATPSG